VPLTLNFGRARWSAGWLMTALTLLAVFCLIELGRWQWHRAAQKRALAAAFSAGTDTVIELGDRATAALPRYTQVRVHGHYDAAHQFLLENISHDGQPGYEALTPLVLADGRALIVNRGWLPLTASRRQLPDIALETAVDATPAGRLDELPVPGIALGRLPPPAGPQWPKLTSFPRMGDLSLALGRPLETRQLLLDRTEPHGFVRDWRPGGLGAERHIAYALQWWGFAALAAGLYLYLNFQRAAR